MLLIPAAFVVFVTVHGSAGRAARADYTVSPTKPAVLATTMFDASLSSCDQKPCAYQWTAKVLRSPSRARKQDYAVLTAQTGRGRRSPVLGKRRILRYVFLSAGPYFVKLTVIDRTGHRSSKVERIAVSGLPLALNPSFVGPGYYSKFSRGPSSSMSFFPIYTYQFNLGQWSQLPARFTAMGVNGVDDAYDASDQNNLEIGAAHGLTFNIMGSIGGRSDSQAVTSYAMQDEPNQTSSRYAASSCSPTDDTCAQAYVTAANAYRTADSTRPVWGNFTKDIDEWTFPPSGWTTAQFAQHESEMLGALNIASADFYGWTDAYEWNQGTGQGTGHYGAWVYGHTVERLNYYNPSIPAYGFVECCDSIDGNGTTKPTNEMMPGMIQAAIWNILVHGGRGYVFWTTNFWDSSSGGDPYADPYTGASYQGDFALYAEHQWDAQYDRARQVDHEVESVAPDLNSPTVTGISATSSSGVPVATLGKDVDGELWLLAQADGNTTYPLSNTTPMTAMITLPSAVPAGTVLNVVGENRIVTVNADHQITDTFGTTTETPFSGKPITYGYQHHIYAMN
jgi:hypothetical protein